MRKIDRFNLTDVIGRTLQSRMTYSDIDAYLRSFGVDTASKKTSGTNSKWVYTKEVLADEADEIILQIANELNIDHPYAAARSGDVSDSRYWLPGHFRLFLSHLSAFKLQTAGLQRSLRRFFIAAFVAHEDIEPTKEWLNEIEKALFSMDALAAILMPGFHESNWTDHEVGIAVGRDVLVIPLRRGLDPYGFIGKYQALQAMGKTIGEVAQELFLIILRNPKTKGKMLDCLVEQLLISRESADITRCLELLDLSESLPDTHAEKLREAIAATTEQRPELRKAVNSLLMKHGFEPTPEPTIVAPESPDIPF